MKIAYLITAYNNPNHLNKLINALNNKSVDFYIHIDKKSKDTFKLPKLKNVYLLKNNIEVFWGSYTFIEAVLLMLKKAKSVKNYEYYSLISGADYPVRSNEYILNFFKKNKGKEFINICKMPDDDKSFNRVDYYYDSKFLYKPNLIYIYRLIINKLVRQFNIKRKFPQEYSYLTLYGGSNWWTLSNNCTDYILDYVQKNPKFCKFYENTYIPEEMFFHTIVGNSKYYTRVTNYLTYTDWNATSGPLPAKIEMFHIPILSKNTIKASSGKGDIHIMFARKFAEDSEDVIKAIDKLLRKNK